MCDFNVILSNECVSACGISLMSGQLVSELFPDCTRSCFPQIVLCRRGGDRIYEMRCLFVAVGPNAFGYPITLLTAVDCTLTSGTGIQQQKAKVTTIQNTVMKMQTKICSELRIANKSK